MRYSERLYQMRRNKKDYTVRELCEEGARAGDPVCLYRLLSKRDEGYAARRLELLGAMRAIACEDREAAFTVAEAVHKDALRTGNGDEYMHYLLLAADQGHLDALEVAASEYSRGRFVPHDLEKANALWLRAAELGDTSAQYMVADRWEHGTHGHEVDLKKALEWYQKAADHGKIDAMLALGRLCMQEDPARAEAYFTDALAKFPSCRDGDYYLGLMCEQRGDFSRAIAHYGRCVDIWRQEPPFCKRVLWGNPEIIAKAAFALGEIYREGKGGAADMETASVHYLTAALHGSAEALGMLRAYWRTLDGKEAAYLWAFLVAMEMRRKS